MMRRGQAPPVIRRRAGQASFEVSVAMVGALLILFATTKVFLWTTSRLVRRQQYYECTRKKAGSQSVKQAKNPSLSPVWIPVAKSGPALDTTPEKINARELKIFGGPVEPVPMDATFCS